MYGMSSVAASDRAADLIGLVDLGPLADQPTRVLSRGQKQRLSLARALVHDPDVLLLDEPASGLDPAARASLRELVRRLAGEGKTVLVSSHVLAELEEMADTAVYLADGETAAPDEVARAGQAARGWRIRSLDAERLSSALEAAGSGRSRWSTGSARSCRSRTRPTPRSCSRTSWASVCPSRRSLPAVGDLEHVFHDLNRQGGEA